MASLSSSCLHLEAKHDVFLSFRGEVTRENFTSHLYAALCRKQIAAFIDDDGLKRGDKISPALMQAIQESKISVIVFSKDYASSKWCLDELVKIIECKEMNAQIVVPVFYRVNPSDVEKQIGSFGDAFAKHEERFKDMTAKVQKWRDALTRAANLPGWDSTLIRPESKLIDEIVRDILKKLNDISTSNDCEGLVGIDSQVEQIKSLLCIGLSDFRVVGIWGMAGIGKTTLAEVVFNQISGQFEGCCFIANVREVLSKHGLVGLKEQLLSKILEERNLSIGTRSTTPSLISRRVQNKTVLIVLDDVDDLEHLKSLTGGLAGFGPGSRIMITTRDKQVLCAFGVQNIYQVKELNDQHAFQLFCNYAFKQSSQLEELKMLSSRIIKYAKGNPLVLKVLGSSLYQKTKQEWEHELYKLKKISNPKIHNVLMSSYDGLDIEERNIFLDIACFFKGWGINYVAKLLDSCYYASHFALSVLIDKSLISITKDNMIQMHDLLQEMSWEIVHQQSPNAPGKRSRLWNHEDAFYVLKNNTGTDAVEGLFLDMSKITELHLNSGAFKNMPNLKFLKLYLPQYLEDFVHISAVHLPRGLKYLSDELRYLYWHAYPLKTLLSNFSPKNLIELNLPYSNLEQLRAKAKHCHELQLIDRDQDVLQDERCHRLHRVPSSIEYLMNLQILNLRSCKSLRSFPNNLHFNSPITLDFSNCINLKDFPQISGSIKELDLSETGIEVVPSEIACLTELVYLSMRNCTRLKSLPTSICKLKSLRTLELGDCSKLDSFPDISEVMECLEDLDLDRTAIKELPSSIQNLNGLSGFSLSYCKNLETIPSSICNLTSLTRIALYDCSRFDELLFAILRPSSISGWRKVTSLSLGYCNLTEIPADFCNFSSLEHLDLGGNNFKSLPRSMKKLSHLKSLGLADCNMLQSIPELPLGLRSLDASTCKQLQSLPEPPSNLENLDESELEILSEGLEEYTSAMDFIFTSCPKVNQNSKNSQQRIQRMAAPGIRVCYEKIFGEIPQINFCLPGSELPDWFNHQCSGSSITIELSQDCCNRRLIGFALSAVIVFGNVYCKETFGVACNYHFQSSNQDFKWEFSVNNFDGLLLSDHTLLGYSPCMYTLLEGDPRIVLFEFSTFSWNTESRSLGKSYMVKCCGFCPLYEEHSMTQPITSDEIFAANSEDFVEAMLVDSTKRKFHDANTSGRGIGKSIEEKLEPLPKRNLRNQVNTL